MRNRLLIASLLCMLAVTALGVAFKESSTFPKPAAASNALLNPSAGEIVQQFGQFPPNTAAEHALAEMLCRKDQDIDLGEANWLLAADIPEFANMARDDYFNLLDGATATVREHMGRMQKV